MRQIYFYLGTVLTIFNLYVMLLWIYVFNKSANREEAVKFFNENIPNLINKTIDIEYVCIIFGVIAIFCFLKSRERLSGILKKINVLLLFVSVFTTIWFLWTLL